MYIAHLGHLSTCYAASYTFQVKYGDNLAREIKHFVRFPAHAELQNADFPVVPKVCPVKTTFTVKTP